MFVRLKMALVAVLALGALASAHAVPIVLTFEGLQDLEPVDSFYNGGLGGSGSGPGPNYGITFGADSLAAIDLDAGGSGNIANEPSPNTVVFFLSGPGVVMNVPAGFTTGFSFFYSGIQPGSVSVYDGLNGTGTLLASLNLSPTPPGPGDPNGGAYGVWAPIGVSFAGVAKSVNFSGAANFIAFDNITLGSQTPGAIPEPSTIVLFVSGLGVAAAARRRAKCA